MTRRSLLTILLSLAALGPVRAAETVEAANLTELAALAAGEGRTIRLKPGVHRMADYLTEDVLKEIRAGIKPGGRPPVPMLEIKGDNNRFDLTGATLEIGTELYKKLPGGGYTRCVMITGNGNHFDGLVIRNSGPNQGSGGNILSVMGKGNTVENFTLHVHGSFPFGYGDLLGKGGPNLVPLQKQSGFQIAGDDTVVRRCRVISRAFGHCFYIQKANNVLLEECYAEGVTRPTSEMLRDTSGPAFERGFDSVYRNREGRYLMVAGYMKSLVEDGFRTYGGTGRAKLVNCTAINTRAGFEISGTDGAEDKTVIVNGTALGCERAYLLGSNVEVRNSRGDIAHGPLLYLRGGINADVELELTGSGTNYTVHALATIAGEGHRVKLTGNAYDIASPKVPVMLGFGMPDHAEMASPIKPAPTKNVTLVNELAAFPVVVSGLAEDCKVETDGVTFTDEELSEERKGW